MLLGDGGVLRSRAWLCAQAMDDIHTSGVCGIDAEFSIVGALSAQGSELALLQLASGTDNVYLFDAPTLVARGHRQELGQHLRCVRRRSWVCRRAWC